MTIGMSWGALEVGQAWGEFPTVDACSEAVRNSVRRSMSRMGPGFRGCMLKRSADHLRERMGTEGLHHLCRGRAWHGKAGTVWVSMYPQGGAKHGKAPHRPGIGR